MRRWLSGCTAAVMTGRAFAHRRCIMRKHYRLPRGRRMAGVALRSGRHVRGRLRLRALPTHCNKRSTVTRRALPRSPGMIHQRRPKSGEVGVAAIASGSCRNVICRLRQPRSATLVTVAASLIANSNRRCVLRMIYRRRGPGRCALVARIALCSGSDVVGSFRLGVLTKERAVMTG
jgi:hypothetical protein